MNTCLFLCFKAADDAGFPKFVRKVHGNGAAGRRRQHFRQKAVFDIAVECGVFLCRKPEKDPCRVKAAEDIAVAINEEVVAAGIARHEPVQALDDRVFFFRRKRIAVEGVHQGVCINDALRLFHELPYIGVLLQKRDLCGHAAFIEHVL